MANYSRSFTTACAVSAMLLVTAGSLLGAFSGGLYNIPERLRLPDYCGLVGLASSAAGFVLGQWVIRRRLSDLETPDSRITVTRREGGVSVASAGERLSSILGMPFLFAMFSFPVPCLFLLIPIVRFLKGEAFDWLEWAAAFSAFAGCMAAAAIVLAVLITIPMIFAHTVMDIDRERIEVRRRRLIPRRRQRIRLADVASVESFYGGIIVKRPGGKQTALETSGSKDENEMIAGLVREACGRGERLALDVTAEAGGVLEGRSDGVTE
jgi:hypothetical protein